MGRWMCGGLALAALVACNGDGDGKGSPDGPDPHTGTDSEPPVPDDADGDGFSASEDCDDADAHVHPGADERCDGVDTDCDPGTPEPTGVVGRSDGDGNVESITQAVAEAGAGATVWICSGTYAESVTIDKDLTVLGLGAVTVDPAGAGPGFDVVSGTVSLTDLTVVHGSGSPNGPAPGNGGGVNAYEATGPVALTRISVSDSTAELGGAVVIGAAGGTVSDCVFENNVSGTHGGALFTIGDTEVSGTTLRRNTAGGYGGGVGLGEDAEVVLRDSVIEGNDATNGGGLFTFEGAAIELTGTVVRDNVASDSGGGLYLWAAEVVGGEVSGNAAGGQGGGVYVYDGSTLTDLTVAGNQAENGGGLSVQGTVGLSGVSVDGNTAADSGGGAWLFEATVTATDTTVSHNHAGARAGGLLLVNSALTGGDVVENDASDGAGIYLSGSGGGPSQLTDVVVSDNEASNSGAGIFAAADFSLEAVDASRNVSADRGGGLYATFSVTGTIDDGSLYGNAAAERGAGVYANAGSTLLFTGTVISYNVALRGAGGYINDGSTLTLVEATIESNGDSSTVTGGGMRVTDGLLVSTQSDWGEGPTDNLPDDVFVEAGQAGYTGYTTGETFACDENACSPLP